MDIISNPTVVIGQDSVDFYPNGDDRRILMRIQRANAPNDGVRHPGGGGTAAVILGAASELDASSEGLFAVTKLREIGRADCDRSLPADLRRTPADLVTPLAALFRDLTWPPVRCARGSYGEFEAALRAAAGATVPIGEQIGFVVVVREPERSEVFLGPGGDEVAGLDRRMLNAFVLNALAYHRPHQAPILFGRWRHNAERGTSLDVPPATAHARIAGTARMADLNAALRALRIEPRDPLSTPEISEDIPF